jgi:hypothetical protein
VIDRITELLEHETAGDPMTGLKWTHRTTSRIAEELRAVGIDISPNTVARLLRQMGYSLRVNHKKLARVTKTDPDDRDAQFARIAELRQDCAARGRPIVSIDTKRKELVGVFKNAGVAWNREPVQVNDHDFASDAIGKAVPYGIYDILANRGAVFVGTSRDTAEFAVDAIEQWWLTEGKLRYEGATELAILADGGGSNGSSNRAWKHRLHCLAQGLGISFIVAHYPPGASKWNPIEHRLFSEISKNWAGRPLDSYETILKYIRSTETTTGLKVRAHLVDRHYEKGVKITDEQMATIRITRPDRLPKWNYTIGPAA